MKNYSFNYFLCFHIAVVISITLKSNFTKECINIYGHISYMIIHVHEYLCIFIHIYTYTEKKNGLNLNKH